MQPARRRHLDIAVTSVPTASAAPRTRCEPTAARAKRRRAAAAGLLAVCTLLALSAVGAAAEPDRLTLSRAEMCEAIIDFAPQNTCAVFSVSRKAVHCFTLFDPVPAKTEIYHRWYHRDKPAATFKLTLQPPRWASYSSMQLRPGDKGPWRVDITDAGGAIMRTLRFSVTD
jgi:hypothetical protein